MKVLNRAGQLIDISFDAIKTRITRLCDEDMLSKIEIDRVVISTINGIYDGITTSELDDLSSRICASLQSVHFMYDRLAARILGSNMEKNMRSRLNALEDRASFSFKTAYVSSHPASTLDTEYAAFVAANAEALDAVVDYSRDTALSYFALRTLEKSYLMRIDGAVVESPQDMWMRVAVAIARPIGGDRSDAEAVADASRIYGAMSVGDYTHATPTLFNAGMKISQCSSCFVENTEVVTVVGKDFVTKKIQDVAIGDKVVTHQGNFKEVSQLHRNPLGNRKIHRLRAFFEESGITEEVVVTDNHPFYARSDLNLSEPEWLRVDELVPNVHFLYAICRPGAAGTVGVVISNDHVPDNAGLGPESIVYTLGVEDDHSYAVGKKGLICKNCYLLGTEDSLSGIFKTISDCAQISKWAGGIGVHVSNVRAKGARIASTNGTSDGIIPMIKVYNEVARYCNQSGRRKGSIAVYLEPWHADVWEFVELKRNTGADTERARDLFLALWVPDEFMRRMEADDDWYLMSPDVCPGLVDAYDHTEGGGGPDDFNTLYNRYVAEGKFVKKMKARVLWQHILTSQLETGVPYMMFKDHVNRKSNQANVGTIRSSNLCVEVCEYSDSQSYAVCNLASIAVNKFVATDLETGKLTVDHERLRATAKQITYNLNRVIDLNFYPTPETSKSNFCMRPIGVGVQGFGDLYCTLKIPYDDPRAVQLDADVMESIYYGCVEGSVELAEVHGPYDRFEGSPASQGRLQFDLWKVGTSTRYDWGAIKERIKRTGMRNSLLTALMPTATTSQILGNCESFEPFQANVYKRSTLAGEFLVVNKHLMRDLMEIGLWTEDFRRQLLASDGSVQKLAQVPDEIKAVYKTVWEVPQRAVIDHSTARGPFVDQSQSMNIFMAGPSFQKLSSALVYGWKSGLKTGVYYLRSQAAVEAIKYGAASKATKVKGSSPRVETSKTKTPRSKAGVPKASVEEEAFVCRRDDPSCEMCGS